MAGQWEGLHVRPLAAFLQRLLRSPRLPALPRFSLHNGCARRLGRRSSPPASQMKATKETPHPSGGIFSSPLPTANGFCLSPLTRSKIRPGRSLLGTVFLYDKLVFAGGAMPRDSVSSIKIEDDVDRLCLLRGFQ